MLARTRSEERLRVIQKKSTISEDPKRDKMKNNRISRDEKSISTSSPFHVYFT